MLKKIKNIYSRDKSRGEARADDKIYHWMCASVRNNHKSTLFALQCNIKSFFIRYIYFFYNRNTKLENV